MELRAKTYIRFVSARRHIRSHRAEGIFQAAYRVRREIRLDPGAGVWLEDVLGWLEENLHPPAWGEIRLPRDSLRRDHTLFWMKGAAREHVQAMRHLVVLLTHHGVATRVLRTGKPGYVVYEDQHQIGAIPFRDGIS